MSNKTGAQLMFFGRFPYRERPGNKSTELWQLRRRTNQLPSHALTRKE